MASLLSACANAPLAPDVVEHTQVVTAKVKVVQPCVAASDVPVRPAPTAVDLVAGDPEQLAAATLADLINMSGYADKLETLVFGCVKKDPTL